MKQRNPIAVFLLPFVTLGIYTWYWLVKTKGEMNKLGETIPTAWIWLIPIVGGIWWLWEYSKGVENVTHGKIDGILAFVVMFLLGNIGCAIVQDTFNKIPAVATPTQTFASSPTAMAEQSDLPSEPIVSAESNEVSEAVESTQSTDTKL